MLDVSLAWWSTLSVAVGLFVFVALAWTGIGRSEHDGHNEIDHSILLENRLVEAVSKRDQFERSFRNYRRISNLLTFGEVVLGGIVASQFFSKIPTEVASAVGILVLLSTLARKSYKPDSKRVADEAKARAARELVREAQEKIASLRETESQDVETVGARGNVAKWLGDQLGLIEAMPDGSS